MDYVKSFRIFEGDDKVYVSNLEEYQRILDNSNGVSISSRNYYNKVINTIRYYGSMATPRQMDILKRIRTGNFTYHPKN